MPSDMAHNSRQMINIAISDIKVPTAHTRKHPAHQIARLADSLSRYGWMTPLTVDGDDTLITGAARLLAARSLGWSDAPAIRVEDLTRAEIRAYRIADNKLAEAASWDEPALRLELQALGDLNIDLRITGFETPEIDILLSTPSANLECEEPVDLATEVTAPVTGSGDLWKIGPHAILCGDARSREDYTKLLGEEEADMVFTDPPYNVPVKGHMGGLGSIQHREFVEASGDMAPPDFQAFLLGALRPAIEHCRPGAMVYVCMDWRSIHLLYAAGEDAGLERLNLCVWNKTNGGMGSLYRSKHELVYCASVPGGKRTNNIDLGRHGRYRTNVWDFPGANVRGGEASEALKDHPTPKPVAMIAEAICDVTHRGDLILDPFGGVGSTLLAAHRVGRAARLIEKDPLYVDAAIRRIRKMTGLEAALGSSGRTFADIERSRRPETQTRAPVRFRPRTGSAAREAEQ